MNYPKVFRRDNKFLILFFILFSFFVLGEILHVRDTLTLAYVKSLFLEDKILGTLLFIVLFSIGNLFYIPGWIFLAAAVLSLGKEYGGIVTYLAALTSSIISYYLVGFIGKDAIRDLKNKWAKKILAQIDRHKILSVISLRTIFQTNPALNYALALSGINFSSYFIGTVLGLPLPIFCYCYFFEILFSHLL